MGKKEKLSIRVFGKCPVCGLKFSTDIKPGSLQNDFLVRECQGGRIDNGTYFEVGCGSTFLVSWEISVHSQTHLIEGLSKLPVEFVSNGGDKIE